MRPLGEPDFYIRKIITAISESKREAWSPAALKSFAKEETQRLQQDPNSRSTQGKSKGKLKAEVERRIRKCERTILLAEVYEVYEQRKREEKKIDFDDLIFKLQQKLTTDQLLLRLLQERFLYILVDEHQDTNDAQNSITELIADFFETPNLFVVGDEKQAIYRFQGASLESFLKFQTKWKTMTVISLEENYRSPQELLDASFSMIEKNYKPEEYKKLRIRLKSKKKGRSVEVALAPDQNTEDIFLIKKIKEISNKHPQKEIAVITRNNKEVNKVFNLLNQTGLEVSAERGVDVWTHPVGALFFSLIEFLSDTSRTESLAETISFGLWDLDFKKQIELTKNIRSGKIENLEKAIPAIKELGTDVAKTALFDYLIAIAELSGINKIITQDPLAAEVWRNIFSLVRNITESQNVHNVPNLLRSLLEYKKTAEKRYIKIGSGNSEARIKIMTAHSSKGMEFDFVFLPYATEESWLPKRFGTFFALPRERGSDDQIRDERRLFYVALTRAKNRIFISSSTEGNGRSLIPVRFIDELNQSKIKRIRLKKEKVDFLKLSTNKFDAAAKERNEYTKRILLENGLSVTALNHFLKCPTMFFYKSILKLPEAPSPTTEKGTAMHEAMATIWQGQNKTRSQIEKITSSTVRNYFKHSYLPTFEKENIVEELVSSASIVARELESHFKTKGKVLVENWVENYFEHKCKNQNIELLLHGKLDLSIEQEKDVLIFDYKTTQVKSVAAIKGETKNSDGDYFRQLVFYKLLLEKNPKYKDKLIKPALVFIRPNLQGKCPTISIPITENDLQKLKSEITLLIKTIWSDKLLSQTCNNPECKYCRLTKNL